MPHTPGPWRTVVPPSHDLPVVRYIFDDEDHTLADVRGISNRTVRECTANARLIAAAPDLLEALEALLSRSQGSESAAAREMALAAINKAKGTA